MDVENSNTSAETREREKTKNIKRVYNELDKQALKFQMANNQIASKVQSDKQQKRELSRAGDWKTPERTNSSNVGGEEDMERQYEELLRNGPGSEDLVSSFRISGTSVAFELKDIYQDMLVIVRLKENIHKIVLFNKKNGKVTKEQEIRTDFGRWWGDRVFKVTSKYCGGLRGM